MKTVSVILRSLIVLAVIAVSIAAGRVFAEKVSTPAAEDAKANDGDTFVGGERVSRAPSSVGRNGVSRKRYPGGADEDDLQVQESLPIPSRTFDGTVSNTAAESTETSESPAHD